MGDYMYNKVGNRLNSTGTGTNAGVSVTVAAPGAGLKLTCLGVEASGDAAAVVTIESPSGTVLWQERFSAAFTLNDQVFAPGEIVGPVNAAMVLKISASTTHCEADIQTGQMSG